MVTYSTDTGAYYLVGALMLQALSAKAATPLAATLPFFGYHGGST